MSTPPVPPTPPDSSVPTVHLESGPPTITLDPPSAESNFAIPGQNTAGGDTVVSVKNLSKVYGNFTALSDVSFDVNRGAIFGLLGPNGAGKSTTLSVIASLLLPTSGSATIGGFDSTKHVTSVRRMIGYMPDQLGVYGTLHCEQYLRFFAAAYRIPKKEWPNLIDGLLELVGMSGKKDVNVDSMSRGMKQRMSLARALVHDPQILLLDEPASGLDPRARVELRELVQQLAAMGKTIIISSHILSELQEMCTDIAIIEGGKMVVSGKPAEIAASMGGRKVLVHFADGTEAEYPVANDQQQIDLLRHLVNEDAREVLGFTPGGDGLEDLFMQLTEGGVR